MIISAAPFRISFAGGGSDIGFYYKRRTGAVLSIAIDKYVYVSIHPFFNRNETLLKYSKTELVSTKEEIKHPIFREALKMLEPKCGVEITSTADIPAGTGLGSSSSFTTALIHALYAFRGTYVSKGNLAEKACEIEIDKLCEPIGKQDQYAAAYGGMNLIEFHPNESVCVSPVLLKKETRINLENNLMLFYLGTQRDSNKILEDQKAQVSSSEEKFHNTTKIVDLAYQMHEQLRNNDLTGFAESMAKGWELKRTLSKKITNERIDNYYELALKAGALGGKLTGAGGGGFLLLYVEKDKQDSVREALADLWELTFNFDFQGSKVIYVGDNSTKEGFYYSAQQILQPK